MIFRSNKRGLETLSFALWLSVGLSTLTIALQFVLQMGIQADRISNELNLRKLQQELQTLHESSYRGKKIWVHRIYRAPKSNKEVCMRVSIEFGGIPQSFRSLPLRPQCPSSPGSPLRRILKNHQSFQ